jgi:hypothetical protein
MPILVKNWNVDGRIRPSLAYPADLLTKFNLPGAWFEEVILRGAED